MPRRKRILLDNSTYHIVQRGHNKSVLFQHTSDYKKFRDIMLKYKKRFAFDIYHYCLMKNHFHILLQISKTAFLPKILQGITQSYSYYYRVINNHSGYVYQNRYKSFIIDKDSYLLECARYIEMNPVRAGVTKHPGEYLWSSYHAYATEENDSLVTLNPLFLSLGKTQKERKKEYMSYVTSPRLYEDIIDPLTLK